MLTSCYTAVIWLPTRQDNSSCVRLASWLNRCCSQHRCDGCRPSGRRLDLEFQVGSIETPSLGQQFSLFDWNGLLATNTYQEGVSSYTGTQDSSVSATNPSSSFGAATTVVVGGTGERTGLVRFDNLFGTGSNQIPLGSTILSASLRLNVTTATSADASISFHRVLENWSEISTYNSLGSGFSLNDAEVSSVADAIVDAPASTGNQLISGLEGSLQAWSDGATNLGWAISGTTSPIGHFSSSEAATSSVRPMLLVSYTPPAAATVELRTTEKCESTPPLRTYKRRSSTAGMRMEPSGSTPMGTM